MAAMEEGRECGLAVDADPHVCDGTLTITRTLTPTLALALILAPTLTLTLSRRRRPLMYVTKPSSHSTLFPRHPLHTPPSSHFIHPSHLHIIFTPAGDERAAEGLRHRSLHTCT